MSETITEQDSEFKKSFVSESIYKMNLHETKLVYDGIISISCTKVHNGWIYNSIDKGHNIMGSVFVPFHQLSNER